MLTKTEILIQGIKDALATDEDRDALIKVARNAHRSEMKLAADSLVGTCEFSYA